jgi:hypothetical protein
VWCALPGFGEGAVKMARNEVCVAGRELSAVDEDLPLFVLLTILSSHVL